MSAPISQDPYLYTARAHAKINVHLGVGAARVDGFHEISSVFQALSLYDTVTVMETGEYVDNAEQPLVREPIKLAGTYVPGVPLDGQNLAWQAIEAVRNELARLYGATTLPALSLTIDKGIPAAGGMAGGSADAAAALRLADICLCPFYDMETLGEEALYSLAADLGSDVPFTLMGGTALGTGRGEELTPMMARGTYHWALITSRDGLSTPTVFRKLDELRSAGKVAAPEMDTAAVSQALISGDAEKLAAAVHNDMQAAALSLRPELRKVLSVGQAAGALNGIVSGSGPTCAFICPDEETAHEVIAQTTADNPGTRGVYAFGPAPGATITDVR